MRIALLVVGLVVVLAIAGALYYPTWKKNKLRAECKAIADDLASQTLQGAGITTLDPLQRALADCRKRMTEAGIDVDEAGEAATDCLASRDRIRREWQQLLVVSYASIAQRDEVRGTILR